MSAVNYSDRLLHILRNPWGFTEDQVREARLWAGDQVERLWRTQDSHAEWQSHALDLARMLRNAVACHSAYCGCEACEYVKTGVPKDPEMTNADRENERE